MSLAVSTSESLTRAARMVAQIVGGQLSKPGSHRIHWDFDRFLQYNGSVLQNGSFHWHFDRFLR